VCFALIGLAVHDPDPATICFPTGYAGAEVLVRVCDSFVIFLFELVFIGIRIGITPAPKLFDKAFALVVSGQFLECLPFFVGDDVSDVLVEPVFVGLGSCLSCANTPGLTVRNRLAIRARRKANFW
jgi:hypothetical protein